MTTRTGKIAQLPKSVRDDLNRRLENGKQSPELLAWLNSLPETQELLTQKFENQPITRSNLSDWRQGGFAEWRADQLREARIQRICETGRNLERAENGDLFENFARITLAEMTVDLDAAQKLRGERRIDRMNHLVRNLSRLQNAYNRSRWADLAWTKYNDGFDSGTGTCRAEALAKANPPVRTSVPSALATHNSPPTTSNAQPETAGVPPAHSSALTPRPSPLNPSSVVPDRAPSQALPPDEGEPKPDGNGMYVLHFTKCNCHEPCPTCHAPDSDYPLEDAIRDHRYYRKYFHYPRDRHGKQRFLINVICDCPCTRCADAEPGMAALPRCPIIHHEHPASDEKLPPPNSTPPPPTVNPSIHLTDFSRRLARLQTSSQ